MPQASNALSPCHGQSVAGMLLRAVQRLRKFSAIPTFSWYDAPDLLYMFSPSAARPIPRLRLAPRLLGQYVPTVLPSVLLVS